jgi:hypothetical protein
MLPRCSADVRPGVRRAFPRVRSLALVCGTGFPSLRTGFPSIRTRFPFDRVILPSVRTAASSGRTGIPWFQTGCSDVQTTVWTHGTGCSRAQWTFWTWERPVRQGELAVWARPAPCLDASRPLRTGRCALSGRSRRRGTWCGGGMAAEPVPKHQRLPGAGSGRQGDQSQEALSAACGSSRAARRAGSQLASRATAATSRAAAA